MVKFVVNNVEEAKILVKVFSNPPVPEFINFTQFYEDEYTTESDKPIIIEMKEKGEVKDIIGEKEIDNDRIFRYVMKVKQDENGNIVIWYYRERMYKNGIRPENAYELKEIIKKAIIEAYCKKENKRIILDLIGLDVKKRVLEDIFNGFSHSFPILSIGNDVYTHENLVYFKVYYIRNEIEDEFYIDTIVIDFK